MRDPDESETVVVDGEDRVAIEIDAIHVGRDAFGGQRRAEPQAPVVRGQAQEVRDDAFARMVVESLDRDAGHGDSGGWTGLVRRNEPSRRRTCEERPALCNAQILGPDAELRR